jgi:hypothetical protein
MTAKKRSIEEFDEAAFARASFARAESVVAKGGVYMAADHEAKQIGFKIPVFALRYLINNGVWPLQRMSSCGGPPKGHKSSFAYQLQRWTLDAGGLVTHIETENKATSDIQSSLLGPKYMNPDSPDKWRLTFVNTKTINEWQQVISGSLAALKEMCDTAGKKPAIPIMYNVDTLMGTDTEEAMARILDTGEAQGRGYGDAAIIISKYLRATSSMLYGYPVFLHFTHQEKPSVGMVGGKTRAGGLAPDFYTSIDLQFSLGGSSSYSTSYKIDRADVSGFNVKMKVRKSSIGPGDREITVPFVWRFIDVDTGTGMRRRQDFQFDWHAAAAELLANMPSKERGDAIRVGSEMSRSGKVYWCKELGISESSPLSGTEFGEALEANTEVVRALEDWLVIKPGQPLEPGALD